jgi:hypothetical protein
MTSFLRASVWLLSILSVLAFLLIAGARLFFPLPLHPVEGAVMDQVGRLVEDAPLYAEPSLQYVPLPIMPGYPMAAASLARMFDPALWQLRLIAILSTLGIALLAIRILWAESKSWTVAFAGAGIFLLASGGVTGACDLGRPGPLALLLVLAGFTQLRFDGRAIAALMAAVWFAAAFFVQIEMGWFALAACLFLAGHDRRRLAWFLPAVTLFCAGVYALLANHWSPWFTWDVPVHALALDPERMAIGMRDLALRAFGPMTVVALLSFAMPKRPWVGGEGAWMWFTAAGLLCGLGASAEPWRGPHAWLPLVVGLSVFGPCAVGGLVKHLAAWPGSSKLAGRSVAVALLALQLVTLLHGFQSMLPPPGVAAEFDHYQAWLRGQSAVLAPGHGYAARMSDREPAYNTHALVLLTDSPGNRLLVDDPSVFARMVDPLRSGGNRPMLLTERPLEESGPLLAPLAGSYEAIRTPPDLLHWRTAREGVRLPTYLYRPIDRSVAQAAADTTVAPNTPEAIAGAE